MVIEEVANDERKTNVTKSLTTKPYLCGYVAKKIKKKMQ